MSVWASLDSSCLGLWASWTYVSISFAKWNIFWHYFFQISFRFLVPALLLLAPHWCECWYIWCYPRRHLNYLHFCGSYFLFAVLIGCFLLPSKSLIWSSVSPNILLIYSSVFFNSVIHFWLIPFFRFHLYFYVSYLFIEVLTELICSFSKFIEHPLNQCFKLWQITCFHFV